MYNLRRSAITLGALLFCSYINIIYSLNDIKGLDDSLLFRINWPGNEDSLLESPLYEKLEMTTTNNELFHCLVPINYGEPQESSEPYTGPNVLNLLMPLFKKPVCTLRLEAYWTYELCHGLHIKQFHEDREGKKAKFQEYTLGTASLESLQKEAKKLDEALGQNKIPDVPQTIIEGVSMPYFPVIYENGTPCDLTGNLRISKVNYVCFDEGRHAVYSVKETFTCEYEIIVLTPLLCQHPSYRPHEVPQTDMHCIPADGTQKRPKNLIHFEAESLTLRNQGGMFQFAGDSPDGLVHIEMVNEGEFIEGEIREDFEGVKSTDQVPFPPQPTVNAKLMEDFLNGDHCLDGGAGWWQYEFCYGKTVHQYHRNRDGSTLIIHLGSFDIEKHKDWIEKNPHKAHREGRRQVSHFYSGGDFCTANGKPRQVEVKLKCKEEPSIRESVTSKTDNAVTLYLLEPKVCEYVLGVETALVCGLMNHADSLGLFTHPNAKENEKVGIDLLLDTPGNNDGWKPILRGTVETVPIDEVYDDTKIVHEAEKIEDEIDVETALENLIRKEILKEDIGDAGNHIHLEHFDGITPEEVYEKILEDLGYKAEVKEENITPNSQDVQEDENVEDAETDKGR